MVFLRRPHRALRWILTRWFQTQGRLNTTCSGYRRKAWSKGKGVYNCYIADVLTLSGCIATKLWFRKAEGWIFGLTKSTATFKWKEKEILLKYTKIRIAKNLINQQESLRILVQRAGMMLIAGRLPHFRVGMVTRLSLFWKQIASSFFTAAQLWQKQTGAIFWALLNNCSGVNTFTVWQI
mgnify:CR=1 FL=1